MSWNNSVWVGGLLGVLGLATACGGNAESPPEGVAGSAGSAEVSANSGAAASGAAAQNPTPTAGTGGGANDPGPDDCAGTNACANTCSAAAGACLAPANESAPLEEGFAPVVFDAIVTAIGRGAGESSYLNCVGVLSEDRIQLSLEDATGKAWDLFLSPEQVDEQRYAVADKLQVSFSRASAWLGAHDRRLLVRKADELDLFFIDWTGYGSASPSQVTAELDGSGLAFESAKVMCSGTSPSGSACTIEGIAVSAGSSSFSEPCAEDVGDFEVTASYRPRYCAPGTEGFCDSQFHFFAAGVRR